MAGQQARHASKTKVRRKEAARGHKASKSRRRTIPTAGNGQKQHRSVFPKPIQFLEVDIVEPFDAALEAEESELAPGGIEDV